MQTQTLKPLKPKVVLGVAAHPDDLEFSAAGTIAKFISDGADAYYLILTNANKGTDDRNMPPNMLRTIRHEEQRAAGKILGLKDVFFCDYEDGQLECCYEVRRDIARAIRQVKPDVVVAMDPSVLYSAEHGSINHPDHRAAGQATLDAVYPLARDHLSFPELLADGLEPHKTATVLLVNFEQQNYYVDISDYIDTKLKALNAHVSQVADPDMANGYVRDWAKQNGTKAGVDYAEGFVRIDIR